MEEGLERWNNQKRRAHRAQFPLSDHLCTLMTLAQVDLTEQERARLTSYLDIRGIPLQSYTLNLNITAFLELFCAPQWSLETPSVRPPNQQRTFLVQDYGELDGSTGYWGS